MIVVPAIDQTNPKAAALTDIIIKWDNQQGFWWNETCAMILEHFGLPGDRYVSHPETDQMTFKFFNEQDALMAKILLSDRL
jgi:hypothetical protein